MLLLLTHLVTAVILSDLHAVEPVLALNKVFCESLLETETSIREKNKEFIDKLKHNLPQACASGEFSRIRDGLHDHKYNQDYSLASMPLQPSLNLFINRLSAALARDELELAEQLILEVVSSLKEEVSSYGLKKSNFNGRIWDADIHLLPTIYHASIIDLLALTGKNQPLGWPKYFVSHSAEFSREYNQGSSVTRFLITAPYGAFVQVGDYKSGTIVSLKTLAEKNPSIAAKARELRKRSAVYFLEEIFHYADFLEWAHTGRSLNSTINKYLSKKGLNYNYASTLKLGAGIVLSFTELAFAAEMKKLRVFGDPEVWEDFLNTYHVRSLVTDSEFWE